MPNGEGGECHGLAIPLTRRTVHFELRAHSGRVQTLAACKGWRNAVDLRHLPEGMHSLAPRPGSLARLTFQEWSAWQESHLHCRRFELRASALGLHADAPPKYKPRGHYLFEDSEVEQQLLTFPPVDVFVAHNSPRCVHDRDDD